jgi:hypothetical protein
MGWVTFWVIFSQTHLVLIFRTFFSLNSIFSQHFWGKIFRGIFSKIFPGKNVRKIGPWSHCLHTDRIFSTMYKVVVNEKLRHVCRYVLSPKVRICYFGGGPTFVVLTRQSTRVVVVQGD